jgi:hypothetical protein
VNCFEPIVNKLLVQVHGPDIINIKGLVQVQQNYDLVSGLQFVSKKALIPTQNIVFSSYET